MMDVIDEDNNILGQASRKEIRAKNLLHRGVAIMVFNSKNKIFVHQRTSTKNIYPSMWDLFAGGGVDAGETYEEAAAREVHEELGITGVPLTFLFDERHNLPRNNAIAKVYKCVYDGEITLQKDEVKQGKFMTLDALRDLMKKETFCPDSVLIFEKFEKHKN